MTCPVLTRQSVVNLHKNDMENSTTAVPTSSPADPPSVVISEVKQKPKAEDERKLLTVMAFPRRNDSEPVLLEYTKPKPFETGTFGTVCLSTLKNTNEMVAIKTVIQDSKYKTRELEIMKSLEHCNVVELKYYFVQQENGKLKLNLVLEYLPQTLRTVIKHHHRFRINIDLAYVRVYIYQLLRGLNYIHSLGICHRDIKPQNLLLTLATAELKICDFGSAKKMVRRETNVAYICSRYYRAPELILGSTNYTTKIDIWSTGCILAELMLGKPIFIATSALDMLVEMIKVLGTPRPLQVRKMNPNALGKYDLPEVKGKKLNVLIPSAPPEAIDLLYKFFTWEPDLRISPALACCHSFFDELRKPGQKLPNGHPLPPLFNLTDYELTIEPTLNEFLIPKWVYQNSLLDKLTKGPITSPSTSTISSVSS